MVDTQVGQPVLWRPWCVFQHLLGQPVVIQARWLSLRKSQDTAPPRRAGAAVLTPPPEHLPAVPLTYDSESVRRNLDVHGCPVHGLMVHRARADATQACGELQGGIPRGNCDTGHMVHTQQRQPANTSARRGRLLGSELGPASRAPVVHQSDHHTPWLEARPAAAEMNKD